MSIAVVLSSYNGENYIIEQLESLKKQTIQPDKVYISDDCSTDKTALIIEQFIKDNELTNWSLHRNSENQGWKKNFFDLLKSVQEDYIFLADQDDIWKENKIERMYKIISTDSKIELLACGYEAFYEDSTKHVSKKITGTMRNTGLVEQIKFNENYMNVLRPGCTFVISKKFFEQIEPFWNTEIAHDAMLWRYAIIRETGYILDENLIHWRRYNTSSSNPNRNKMLYKNRYELLYKSMLQSNKVHVLFLNGLSEYLKYSKKECEHMTNVVHENQKFEIEYGKALQQLSVKGLLLCSVKYRQFFLSRKSIVANTVRLVMYKQSIKKEIKQEIYNK